MKLYTKTLLVAFLTVCVGAMSTQVEAVDHQFAVKVGHMTFIGDKGWNENSVLGDDSAVFNGRNWALEWDMYTARYFGLRFSLEYFHQKRFIPYSPNSDDDRGEYRSLVLVPLTVSTKWKIPTPIVAPYVYIGLGLYSWGIYENRYNSSWYWSDDTDDHRAIREGDSLGFQVGTGLECVLGPRIAMLMEVEYRAVDLDWVQYRDDESINASSLLFTLGLLFR